LDRKENDINERRKRLSFPLWLAWISAAITSGSVMAQIDPTQEARVGFVTHYHEGSLDELNKTPVTAELADLIHWRMVGLDETNPHVQNMRVDFGHAENWLALLDQGGRSGYPIIDTSLYHSTIPWRREMSGRANQNLVGVDGNVWNFSSLHSPIFRESVFSYIDQFTEWFRSNDTRGLVPGYLNGAEWFYPGSLDYNPLALEAFRNWLEQKYGSLSECNRAWGSEYGTWKDVIPPRPFVIGGYHFSEPTFALDVGVDASFAHIPIPVQPGCRYMVSTMVSGEGVGLRSAGFHLAWLDGSGRLITISGVHGEMNERGQLLIHGVVQAPANAVTVILHCKLLAWGQATFWNPECRDGETGLLLTTREVLSWEHQSYLGRSAAKSRIEGKDLLLTLEAQSPEPVQTHTVLALEDWVVFSYEAMATWLNDCAKRIRAGDPDREISSYVGFVFAQKAQWDHAMVNQRLDISLMNTPDIDVNGIQMCIAGNDFTWATHVVDMARKYGKPVRATDLIDFPYGLYSGFEPIYRGTMACVQHGLSQVFWYGWKGVPDYSFLQRMTTVDRDRLVLDTRQAIAATKEYRPVIRAAQLMPLMSYSVADEGGYKGDMLDHGGFYDLVLDAGIMVDVWTPYEIEKREENPLLAYEVLFLSDCPVLPREVHSRLTRFVEEGGTILGSGRLPEMDLRGEPFETSLASSNRVHVLGDRMGRQYWGRLRREQVYGNTPPVLVEAPDLSRVPEHRRILRERVRNALARLEDADRLSLIHNHGDVHASLLQSEDRDQTLLFLVHKAPGRCHHVDLRPQALPSFSSAEAWCDFDRRHPCDVLEQGILRTPDFAHVCLVTLSP